MTDVILHGKQAAFVEAYVANELLPDGGKLPLYKVALKAGVAEKSAERYASVALKNPSVLAAIAVRKRELTKTAAADVDAVAVIREWCTIAFGDPTRITHVRRLNCRHCWGINFAYQRTDAEFAHDVAQALEDANVSGVEADMGQFVGGGGFRHTRDPNKECPECEGEGVEDVYIADMRKLPPEVRRLIASVEQTKHGIKVTMRDQDAALQRIAQHLGLLIERKEHSGPGGGAIPVANVNYNLPSDPQEASRAYQSLMEGKL